MSQHAGCNRPKTNIQFKQRVTNTVTKKASTQASHK